VWDLNYLANGKADALSGYISFEPYMLDKMGISYNIIKPEDYGVDFYGDLLFSTQDYVKNNNTQVDNIKSALIKGWEYAFAHQEEMADYILALPGVINRGVTKDILLKEAAAIYKLAEPDLISIGHMNHGRWQTILNTHKQLGLSPQNITLDGFIYTQIPVEYKGKFRLVFYISLALLVCIIFVLSYNYLLKKEVREQTNALRKTTEELLLSNAELEKFAYVASHNLRAPVVNIISLMQLYDRNNPSSPDNDYIITKLNDTTKNLSNTLKDLIHVVSSNDVNNDLQSLNIEQVFNEVKESISELIVETNTLITCKFATTEVYYSHKALSSILLNLITNSIKYRKPNSPAVIELLTITKKDGIEIQVKDNGIGIDLDKYGEKLFGLFQRFNTNIEGSGIGLHIIKKQIETLGGKISVNSAVNIGTTVTVNIKRNL
ncbi:MAG: ABC transporter substrate-binding protein, partial [Bacteroidia bacterium]|nr:ABC transporter substrate-binding protein [Bacteroidia bacterium]